MNLTARGLLLTGLAFAAAPVAGAGVGAGAGYCPSTAADAELLLSDWLGANFSATSTVAYDASAPSGSANARLYADFNEYVDSATLVGATPARWIRDHLATAPESTDSTNRQWHLDLGSLDEDASVTLVGAQGSESCLITSDDTPVASGTDLRGDLGFTTAHSTTFAYAVQSPTTASNVLLTGVGGSSSAEVQYFPLDTSIQAPDLTGTVEVPSALEFTIRFSDTTDDSQKSFELKVTTDDADAATHTVRLTFDPSSAAVTAGTVITPTNEDVSGLASDNGTGGIFEGVNFTVEHQFGNADCDQDLLIRISGFDGSFDDDADASHTYTAFTGIEFAARGGSASNKIHGVSSVSLEFSDALHDEYFDHLATVSVNADGTTAPFAFEDTSTPTPQPLSDAFGFMTSLTPTGDIPSDGSDIELYVDCWGADGSTVAAATSGNLFDGFSLFALMGSNSSAQYAVTDTDYGSASFGNGARLCYGESVWVEVDLFQAFVQAPELEDLAFGYDRDEDADGYTRDGTISWQTSNPFPGSASTAAAGVVFGPNDASSSDGVMAAAFAVSGVCDCNDTDGTIYPETYFADADGDGNGDPDTSGLWCVNTAGGETMTSEGVSDVDDDCNDDANTGDAYDPDNSTDGGAYGEDYDCNGVVHCLLDRDGDGHATTSATQLARVTLAADTYQATCDNMYFGNLDGHVEALLVTSTTANTTNPLPGSSWKLRDDTADDCDDTDSAVNPDATGEAISTGDAASTIDYNCDGYVFCYADGDSDGWGATAVTTEYTGVRLANATQVSNWETNGYEVETCGTVDCPDTCSNAGHATEFGDCADGVGTVFPGSTAEAIGSNGTATRTDSNCDGFIACVVDSDDDGHGTTSVNYDGGLVGGSVSSSLVTDYGSTTQTGTVFVAVTPGSTANSGICASTSSFVDGAGAASSVTVAASAADDCVDSNAPTIYAGAPEDIGDDYDRDCDGQVTCYLDSDGDGFGLQTADAVEDQSASDFGTVAALFAGGASQCETTGYASVGGDCDDEDPSVHESVALDLVDEIVQSNGQDVDEDCDGTFDCYVDEDNDGFGRAYDDSGSTIVGTPEMAQETYGGTDHWAAAQWTDSSTYLSCDNRQYRADEQGDCHDTPDSDNPEVDNDLFHPGATLCLDPVTFDYEAPNGSGGCDSVGWILVNEVPGNAYDDDCDGSALCLNDGDGDGVALHPDDWYASWDSPSWDANTADGIDLTYPSSGTWTPAAGSWPFVEDSELDAATDPLLTITCAGANEALVLDGSGLVGVEPWDCADNAVTVYPGNPSEAIGEGDQDCDGDLECYVDADGDGFGGSTSGELLLADAGLTGNLNGSGACSSYAAAYNSYNGLTSSDAGYLSFATVGGDCHDGVGMDHIYPGNGLAEVPGNTFAVAGGTSSVGLTGSAYINHVGDVTNYAAVDENCDGVFECYSDFDGDGFGGAVVETDFPAGTSNGWDADIVAADEYLNCLDAVALTTVAGGESNDDYFDCHDNEASANPEAAAEIVGNAFDDDCDGYVDCYLDQDDDGYGTEVRTLTTGTMITYDMFAENDDYVDDYPAGITSGDEAGLVYYACGLDSLTGLVDAASSWYTTNQSDIEANGYAAVGGVGNDEYDCHDDNANAYLDSTYNVGVPGNDTDGNAYDYDCDGWITCYRDLDGDGYGTFVVHASTDSSLGFGSEPYVDAAPNGTSPNSTTYAVPSGAVAVGGISPQSNGQYTCADPTNGYASLADDCHDNYSGANPGVTAEVAGDAWDNDCDGSIDCFEDLDDDGYGSVATTYLKSVFSSSSTRWIDTAGGNGTTVRNVTFNGIDAKMKLYFCGDTRSDVESATLAAGLPVEPPADGTTDGDALVAAFEVDGRSSAGGLGDDMADFDCHDDWAEAHPGAAEVVGDPFDNDCNGFVSCYEDQDGDGYGIADVVNLPTWTSLAYDSVTETFSVSAPASQPSGLRFTAASGTSYDVLPGFERLDLPDDSGSSYSTSGMSQLYLDELFGIDITQAALQTPAEYAGYWYDCRVDSNTWTTSGRNGTTILGGEAGEGGDCHDEVGEDWLIPTFTTMTASTVAQCDADGGQWACISGTVTDPTGYVLPENGACPASSTSVCIKPLLDNGAPDYENLIASTDRWDDLSDASTGILPQGWLDAFETDAVSASAGGSLGDIGEIPGNIYDEDCDGLAACFYDEDGDGVGNYITTAQAASNGHYSCDNSGLFLAQFAGDCDDSDDQTAPPVAAGTLAGTDVKATFDFAAQYQTVSPNSGNGGGNYDLASTSACQALSSGDDSFMAVCTWKDSNSSDEYNLVAMDRMGSDDCSSSDLGGVDHEIYCIPEQVGDTIDQNCDDVVGCWYDADDDGFTSSFGAGSFDLYPQDLIDSAGFYYDCASDDLTQLTGNNDDDNVDCNDDESRESPGQVELGPDSLLGVTLANLATNADLTSEADKAAALASVGNDLDEDCSGSFSCWEDVDGDGWGGGVIYYDGAPLKPSQIADGSGNIGTLLDTIGESGGASIDDLSWSTNGNPWQVEPTVLASVSACSVASGVATQVGDCLDNALTGADVHPDDVDPFDQPSETDVAMETTVEEVGNDIDEDCDGIWWCYKDADGDGQGDKWGFGSAIDAAAVNLGQAVVGDFAAADYELPTCDSPSDGVADDAADCLDAMPTGEAMIYYPIKLNTDGTEYVLADELQTTATSIQNSSVCGDAPDDDICWKPVTELTFSAVQAAADGQLLMPVEIVADGIDGDCDGYEDCLTDNDGDGTFSGGILSNDVDLLGRGLADVQTARDEDTHAEAGGAMCDDSQLWPVATQGSTPGLGYGHISWPGIDLTSYFDCDDDDETRAPTLTETYYDGIDADCDGQNDFDADGDGYEEFNEDAEALLAARTDCTNVAQWTTTPWLGCGDYNGDDCNDDETVHPAPLLDSVEDIMAELEVPIGDRAGGLSNDELVWAMLQLTYLDKPALVPETASIDDLMFDVFDQDLVDLGGGDYRSKAADQSWEDVYDDWFLEQRDQWDFISMSEAEMATFLSYEWTIRSVKETCESGATQIDNDCSGVEDGEGNNPGVNHSLECVFHVSDWAAAQEDVWEVEGVYTRLMRDPYTVCADDVTYWSDHSDAVGLPPATLDSCDLADGVEDGYLDYACVESAFPDEVWIADPDSFRWCGTWPYAASCDWLSETAEGQLAHLDAVATVYYLDSDDDTEGSDTQQGYRLCDVNQADEPFRTSRTDCDDSDGLVRTGADEVCDGVDNDCDDEIDDPIPVDKFPDDFDQSNGSWHYVDLDEDGYGDGSIASGEEGSLFICNAYEDFGASATSCKSYENGEPATGFADHGHLIDGDCYVPNSEDCADGESSVHPTTLDNVDEILDGWNNDCDGYIPLVELDCDGDGAFAVGEHVLGLGREAAMDKLDESSVNNYFEFSSAAELGLADCVPGSTFPITDFQCWGTDIPLQVQCDEVTGLWMVKLSTIEETEVWEGYKFNITKDESSVCRESSYWDCDDRNPSRCYGDGVEEVCDGVDNDCNDFFDLMVPDDDGVPSALETSEEVAPGYVQAAELDRDADDAIECDKQVLSNGVQSFVTYNGVALSEEDISADGGKGGDCIDTCSLIRPLSEEEQCNGFIHHDMCDDAYEDLEWDDDADSFSVCGAMGNTEAEGASVTENIYVMAFVRGDTDSLQSPDVKTFEGVDTVVPLVVPRRYSGDNFRNTSVHNEVRECDAGLNTALEELGLVMPDPALADYEAEAREVLLDFCVRARTCSEYAALVAEGGDLDEVLDDEGAIVDRDSGQAPAPPASGNLGLPDYCSNFVDETGAINGQCVTLELTLTSDGTFSGDEDVYDPSVFMGLVGGSSCLYGTEDGTAYSRPLYDFVGMPHPFDVVENLYGGTGTFSADDSVAANATDYLQNADQVISRTVWSQSQIVQARKLVVDYECFRLDGTFGCNEGVYSNSSDVFGSWSSPYTYSSTDGGHFHLDDFPVDDALWDFDLRNKATVGMSGERDIEDDITPDWWLYLSRYNPTQLGSETLYGCWGDPSIQGLEADFMNIDVVGGDCIESIGEKNAAPDEINRGMAEGPADLMGLYDGALANCDSCLDGLDNNCNGLADSEDPTCKPCFVGQGYGLGCGGCSSGAGGAAGGVPVFLLLGLAGLMRRRREEDAA